MFTSSLLCSSSLVCSRRPFRGRWPLCLIRRHISPERAAGAGPRRASAEEQARNRRGRGRKRSPNRTGRLRDGRDRAEVRHVDGRWVGPLGWSSRRLTNGYHAEPGPQAWHIRPAGSARSCGPCSASANRGDRDAMRRRDDHQAAIGLIPPDPHRPQEPSLHLSS
jgi:hypothetical protein